MHLPPQQFLLLVFRSHAPKQLADFWLQRYGVPQFSEVNSVMNVNYKASFARRSRGLLDETDCSVRAAREAACRAEVAIGYYCRHQPIGALVDLQSLVLTVAYGGGASRIEHGRIAGFQAMRIPWGVQWGGPQLNVFDKDLTLNPRVGGPGRHFDPHRPQLLQHVTRLHLYLAARRSRPHRALRLPKLWAAFERGCASNFFGDGPELAQLSRQLQIPASALFTAAKRLHVGLVLYPLDWASHYWKTVVGIFADLSTFPKRQVLRLEHGPSDLQGYRGAVQFDLVSSRFRPPRTAA